MKLTLALIRSGHTRSGEMNRYVGMQDESLTARGREVVLRMAGDGRYPTSQLVFSSMLLRCRETAGLIYPKTPAIALSELNAFDYGEYAGKTYGEVIKDPFFPEWASARHLRAFPGGEEPHTFTARCGVVFRYIAREMMSKKLGSASVITHQEVIKNIFHRFFLPRSLYRDWPVEHGRGYVVVFDPQLSAIDDVREI